MKIRILYATVVNNQAVMPGTILDADPADARLLIRLGKAAPVVEVERAVVSPPETRKVKRGAKADHPTSD